MPIQRCPVPEGVDFASPGVVPIDIGPGEFKELSHYCDGIRLENSSAQDCPIAFVYYPVRGDLDHSETFDNVVGARSRVTFTFAESWLSGTIVLFNLTRDPVGPTLKMVEFAHEGPIR